MDSNSSGKFTIGYALEMIRHWGDIQEVLKKIWIKGLSFKINFFFWILCKQRLPIREVIRSMVSLDIQKCCCSGEEVPKSWDSLFITSPMAVRFRKFFASTIARQDFFCS